LRGGIAGDIEALVQQVRYTIRKAGRPEEIVTYYVMRAGGV
jgi:hypothetical protein